ncbi:hypothetical protein SKAU_G00255740 [Synaphobranchus kaupii]|uniref:Uncharacterized protein n=1 Tax=Synaphobranchus kaupii TaxID=118154 RepID=A0A9Q1F3R5_SYNKA|nr:hypothetical protein SKAU_G00255740 [Synaphobranchus kaupii]
MYKSLLPRHKLDKLNSLTIQSAPTSLQLLCCRQLSYAFVGYVVCPVPIQHQDFGSFHKIHTIKPQILVILYVPYLPIIYFKQNQHTSTDHDLFTVHSTSP